MRTAKVILSEVLALLAAAALCDAQGPLGLVREGVDPAERQAAIDAAMAGHQPLILTWSVPSTPIAEDITGDIKQLARNLENDPVRIFNYVHDHIRHVLYFGSEKGAELTYLEKSGNDFDQCALLVALLRAAGYNNLSYQFGWMELPYDSADHKDLHHWLQLGLSNTNWNYTSNYLDYLVRVSRGYPADAAIWGTNTFAFQRLWVKLTIGSTNYYLDPSFKVSEPITGIDLQAATGFSSNSLMSTAAGTDTADYASGLNEAAIRGSLAGYATNLLNYIQSNYANASVAQVLSGWQIVPSTNTGLSQSPPFTTTDWGGQMPIITWTNQPTDLMSAFYFTFYTNTAGLYMPALEGDNLTVNFYDDLYVELWLGQYIVAEGYDNDATGQFTVSVHDPIGYWDTNHNTFVNTYAGDKSATAQYFNSNDHTTYYDTYNLSYAFEPDWGWLQRREDVLDTYRQQDQGTPDDQFFILAETLNVMGLQFQLQNWLTEQVLASQAGILTRTRHNLTRVAQEDDGGYYYDNFLTAVGDVSNAGQDAANADRVARFNSMAGYFGSALEHGIIEQLNNSNYLAASTIKMIEIANTNGQRIYLAATNNWQTGVNVQGDLLAHGYTSADVSALGAFIARGDTLLLPQYGYNSVNGPGTWSGYGFVDQVSPGNIATLIHGLYGGQVDHSNAVVNTPYVEDVNHKQPDCNEFVPHTSVADPVDPANGTFQLAHTDLSLGQPSPRGLSFNRYYSGEDRHYSQAGMAAGWTHNYFINALAVAAPQAGLGGTTPAQMAPMIAATVAALGIYNQAQPDPKNWTVSALIAKWAADQLTKKGVSVTLGRDIIQFVQQPDGTFTAPGNCTWTLRLTNGAYALQQRHANTFNFLTNGPLASLVDPYNQTLTVSYLSSGSFLPSLVSDWKNRFFQFHYNNGILTNVTDDSTSRKALFGYTANAYGLLDLTSVTDPESKTSTMKYDSDHQIIATLDALSQLVTTNIYDPYGLGLVVTQYTQGDLNRAWKIFWSGWQTVVQDPAGGKQRFFYDDAMRWTAFQDALGNLPQMVYDGQSHVVATISPLNETNRTVFDASHNPIQTIDPLNNTNFAFFDGLNNLYMTLDARGNPTTFGHNAQFSLTGVTNGAGDWLNFAFNTDGTPYSRSDSGGTILFGQDANGYLNSVTYPSGLGSESFVNNALGDLLIHINPRGFGFTNAYNLRRQFTNTTVPGGFSFSAVIDANGNVVTNVDAKAFATSRLWSPTRHLLATIFPATPQGTPSVTNIYDVRDWLSQTIVNPVSAIAAATIFTNNTAGWLVSLTDPVQRTTFMGHDADGRATATTNAAQEVVKQQFSPRGEPTLFTDNANHTVQRAFDRTGNEVALTNRNSNAWQFVPDAANRTTNTVTPLRRTNSVVLNDRGLPSILRQPSGNAATNLYDALKRLTNHSDAVATTFFGLDLNGNVTLVTNVGQASRLAFGFDSRDLLTAFTNADGLVIQYRNDANGYLTNITYPGNKNVYYLRDSLNRVTNVTDWANRQVSVEWDLASRPTKISRFNGTVRSVLYDAAGEATNIVEQFTSGFPIAFFRLNFDLAGRVQWEFSGPLPHAYTNASRAMIFDDDNRLATLNGQTVTNDLDGNMVWGPGTNNTFTAYAFNARNWLLAMGGLQYGYDPLGNRTSITNGTNVTRFVIDPNAALPQPLMRVKNGVTNYYVHCPGIGLLYEGDDAGNVKVYHFDYRGSTVALTDGNGNITDRIEYSVYGLTTYRAGTTDTPFLFNGRYGVQTDRNGLLYMRARYYNPYICRFINADPAGFGGGFNFYAFADGNPVSMVDPFGLGAEESSRGSSWLDSAANWVADQIDEMEWNDRLKQLDARAHPGHITDPLPFVGNLVNASGAALKGDVSAAERYSRQLGSEGLGTLLTLGTAKLIGLPVPEQPGQPSPPPPQEAPMRLVVGGGTSAEMPALQPGDISLNIDPAAEPHVVGDINAAPFKSGSFGCVYFENVEYDAFTGPNIGALAEAGRVLQPGGALIIETGPGVMSQLQQIEEALRQAGFGNFGVQQPFGVRITATMGGQ